MSPSWLVTVTMVVTPFAEKGISAHPEISQVWACSGLQPCAPAGKIALVAPLVSVVTVPVPRKSTLTLALGSSRTGAKVTYWSL